MSIVIADGSNKIIINNVTFDEDSNGFLCFEDADDDAIFRYDLSFKLDEVPSDKYTEKIFLFKNDLITNNTLFKIKLKEKPEANKHVGYAFPMSALKDNPDLFSNEHLKKMAFNVIQKLLSEKDLSIKSNHTNYRSDAAYQLSDFYDEDIVIISICDQLVTFENYDFMNYLPSLYKYGFRFAPHYNFATAVSECNVITNKFAEIKSGITLSIPSNQLHLNHFINSLLKNELFLKDNEIARFHLYYQVIEMMMEKVYKNEFNNELIKKFSSLSSFDLKDSQRNMTRESYSLDKLVGSNYTTINSDILEELSVRIEDFLSYVQVALNVNDISSKIYKVRNTLFHGYSKILEKTILDKRKVTDYLKKVNDSFEYLIIDVITTYQDHILKE